MSLTTCRMGGSPRAARRRVPLLRRLGRRAMVAVAVVAMSGCSVGCVPEPIADRGYVLVFDEQFNGTELSPRWQTPPTGNALSPGIGYGVMTLRTTAANGYSWGLVASTGPRLATEPNYPFITSWQEGYFEARIRYSDNRWAWPGFWLFGDAKVEAWPGEDCRRLNAEWDIMENGAQNSDGSRPASSWSFTALHRNTSDGTSDGYCGIPDTQRQSGTHHSGTNLSDWHVWAGAWVGNLYCTYLDGKLIQCMAGYDSGAQPMHIVFSILYLRNCVGCGARPADLWMQVDWVRVWQPR